jgi:nitrogen regulatory protein PII
MSSEVYLVVRPEEKQAVETAIQTVAGAVYTTYNVLGRGAGGGLRYGASKSRLFSFLRPSTHAAAFLPKVAFYLVVPDAAADVVLERVGAALRIAGGPELYARGLGIVAPAIREIEIGATSQERAAPVSTVQHLQLAGASA